MKKKIILSDGSLFMVKNSYYKTVLTIKEDCLNNPLWLKEKVNTDSFDKKFLWLKKKYKL
jgi:hypothetical protein|tara:strand:+ start:6313 stop:6492 length:180 start_codon:yes stop_codon:yes gene_type:complete